MQITELISKQVKLKLIRMSDSYVTSKAILRCSCGDRTAKITVYPDRTVEFTEKPAANISDHISMYNIAPFGKCHTIKYPLTGAATAANKGKLTPMPCVPGTDTDWINGKEDYIIKGKSALLKSSYCRCKWGGIITIIDDGQDDTGAVDDSRESKETEDEIKKRTEVALKVEPEAVLDGIQLALDAAGFAPGVGAIPDLLNAGISAIRGDWGAAGLSVLAAVPVIGDAVTAAKYAHKGLKAAKIAKKTGVAVKEVPMIRKPFGTLTAKSTQPTPSNQPFLSLTAKSTQPTPPNQPFLSLTAHKNTQLTPSNQSSATSSLTSQNNVAKSEGKVSSKDSESKLLEEKNNNLNSNNQGSVKEKSGNKDNQPKPKDSESRLLEEKNNNLNSNNLDSVKDMPKYKGLDYYA